MSGEEKEVCIPGLDGLRGDWSLGNTLVLYSSSKNGEPSLKELSWETSLFHGDYRKLVNESAATFLNLQKSMSGEEDDASKSASLLRLSRQYRSILKDIQSRISEEKESELLYKLELLWNLAEILLVQKTRLGTILPQLLHWIALHFNNPDELTRDILSEDIPERPESHGSYWKALTLFLLQGRTEQALKLLHLHSEMNSEPYLSLEELIRKMPFFKGNNMSIPDFEFRWGHWQTEVSSRISEGDFSSSQELSRLAALLSGSEKGTWYEWMCGKLLYTNPIVKVYNLPYHAEQALSAFGGLEAMCTLDAVILATMEMDIPAIMHELCSTLDNFCLEEKLTKVVASNNNDNPNSIWNQLISHHSLWQVGVLYFDHCPLQGSHRLEAVFERIPINNENKANKVIIW
ncbi:Nuclear pore complex protein Nup85like, partial [Caligus rogercresseyi]